MKSFCSLSRTLGLLTMACLAVTAHAQTDAVDQHSFEAQLKARAQVREQARQEIAAQRQDIQARQSESEKACWQRFAVEDCLRSVRSQAREQDNVLRERELRINSEEREDNAAQRMRDIERKRAEKQIPAPMQVMPRKTDNASANAPVAAPLAAPVVAPKTDADIERAKAQRASEASARAAEQAERLKKQQAKIAEHEAQDADRRERVKKNMLQKQQEAEKRRAAKADDIANRKGAPLPIPEGLPQP